MRVLLFLCSEHRARTIKSTKQSWRRDCERRATERPILPDLPGGILLGVLLEDVDGPAGVVEHGDVVAHATLGLDNVGDGVEVLLGEGDLLEVGL